MIVLAVAVIVIAAAVVWAVSAYNSLVKLRNKGDEAEAAIDAHLKERYDLIPSLVETANGHGKHEISVLEDVVNARE